MCERAGGRAGVGVKTQKLQPIPTMVCEQSKSVCEREMEMYADAMLCITSTHWWHSMRGIKKSSPTRAGAIWDNKRLRAHASEREKEILMASKYVVNTHTCSLPRSLLHGEKESSGDEEENNLLTCVSIALANKSLTPLEPPRGLSAESVIKILVCISPVHSLEFPPRSHPPFTFARIILNVCCDVMLLLQYGWIAAHIYFLQSQFWYRSCLVYS